MKKTPIDLEKLTAIASYCNMKPYKDRFGNIQEGLFTLIGYNAPIDLTACACDEKSILKTAVLQLSEIVDDLHDKEIENDYNF